MPLIKRLLLFFGIALCILLGLLFIPKSYDVLPFVERPGTEYWELATRSRIGYFKISSSAEEKKTPIIYLHGGPGGLIRDEVIETLSPLSEEGHELYFYDQIGSGHSERLENINEYSVERHRRDLEEIVNLVSEGKVILIGHSWGSLLAVNYLQQNPLKVEKLIVDGPGPILPIRSELRTFSPPDSLNLRSPEVSNADGNREAQNLRSRLIEKLARGAKKKLASDAEADEFFTYLNEHLNKSTSCSAKHTERYRGGGGYYSHVMTVNSFSDVEDGRNSLGELKLPVLVIRGQCDNQSWGYAEEYLTLFQNAHFVQIDDAGHDLIESKREEYFGIVQEFLK